MRVLAGLIVAVALFALAAPTHAQPPDKQKDSAAKAKALLILSGCETPDCPMVKKAKNALATSGLTPPAPIVAPPPREKHVSTPAKAETPEKMTPDLDCRSGVCHPLLPGYTRGADGVYRPNGVAPIPQRR